MAVVISQDIKIPRADLEAVSESMGVRDNPPDGLILHLLTDVPEGVHVTDVWESAAQFQKFLDEQLMPGMQKVMAERGISVDESALPQPSFEEAYDIVRGR